MLARSLRSRRNRERGQMIPIVALAAVVLIGSTALAADLSVATHFRRNLQNITDGAALAGAKLLPVSPALTDQIAATASALAVVHNADPWVGPGPGALSAVGCAGTQCSVTVCAGMTAPNAACTAIVSANGNQPFSVTVNTPPKTAKVTTYNTDSDRLHRVEVVMYQQSGDYFAGIFGRASDQEGAQSIAFHFAPNQPLGLALYSKTVVGAGNVPETIQGNIYTERYVQPQSGGQSDLCADFVPPPGSGGGFLYLGTPQMGDTIASGPYNGQTNPGPTGPGQDFTPQDRNSDYPVQKGVGACPDPVTGSGGGAVMTRGNPSSDADCAGAFGANASGSNLTYNANVRACEATPVIPPPSLPIPTPPTTPVICGATGATPSSYNPGVYECSGNRQVALTVNAPLNPGIYAIRHNPSAPEDVLVDGTVTNLSNVTFELQQDAVLTISLPHGGTVTQTPYTAGNGTPGDGRYLVYSVPGTPCTVNVQGGSTNTIWQGYGVVYMTAGTFNADNKSEIYLTGQAIVYNWNVTSGYHPGPTIAYGAGLLPGQFEQLKLVE